jgi:hypothetical protein
MFVEGAGARGKGKCPDQRLRIFILYVVSLSLCWNAVLEYACAN